MWQQQQQQQQQQLGVEEGLKHASSGFVGRVESKLCMKVGEGGVWLPSTLF
jgi:hypothetical protein